MSQPAPISLGPFDLGAVIGHGGMAHVWHAVHRDTGWPVAIKILTSDLQDTPLFVRAFRREIQTVARLNHPNIITILDHGAISAEAAAVSQGRLPEGGLWLAMELAEGGTLRSVISDDSPGPQRWSAVKGALLALLDALAYAHARDIVHLDLKPVNVLWCLQGAVPGWRLTDFGVAHAADQARSASLELSCGTPSYMAPEQVEGRWRDYGPWTDLYTLGVMAYELITGHVPFQGDSPVDTLQRHLRHPVPDVAPRFQVPTGFEPWLQRLMAKEPRDRFQRAADAAWTLLTLGDPPAAQAHAARAWRDSGALNTLQIPAEERPAAAKKTSAQPTQPISITADPSGAGPRDAWEASSANANPSTPDMAARLRPPTPTNWAPLHRRATHQALRGAGLGLVGIREVPFVGREAERDHLWGTLRETIARGQVHLVVVSGPMGVGKSRLARWLCERAHEVGAAETLQATFDSQRGEGLAEMLVKHLRCTRLSAESQRERIQTWLQAHGVEEDVDTSALTELMSHDHARHTHWWTPEERGGPIHTALKALARHRPAVVWLDDAHWGGEALALLQLALEAEDGGPCPLLFIATARDDVLRDRPEIADRFRLFEEHDCVSTLKLDKLPSGDLNKLTTEALGLAPSLAAQVAARSDGNPLFATQLVEDWAQRGWLASGPQGFTLHQNTSPPLPASLHRLWQARVARLLEGRSRHDRVALELAAVLGQRIRDAEWRSACMDSMIRPGRDLIDDLVTRGLAEWSDAGWSFIHGMLRESLVHNAQRAGRLPLLHRACAEMLNRLYNPRHPEIVERLGQHLLGACLFEPATDALLRAAVARCDHGDLSAVTQLLDLRRDALTQLKAAPADPRWGDNWICRARAARMRGELNEAALWIERLEPTQDTPHPDETVEIPLPEPFEAPAPDDASATPASHVDSRRAWALVRARGLLERGAQTSHLGQARDACDHYKDAVACFEALEDTQGRAQGLLGLGEALASLGDPRQAWSCTRRALEGFEEVRDDAGIADALRALASLAAGEKRWERALDLFQRAMARHERLRNRYQWARCLLSAAQARRHKGDLKLAHFEGQRALALLEPMGVPEAQIARLHLTLIQLAGGHTEEAEVMLDETIDACLRTRQRRLLSTLYAARVFSSALRGSWEEALERLTPAIEAFAHINIVKVEEEVLLKQAAALARAQGQPHVTQAINAGIEQARAVPQ